MILTNLLKRVVAASKEAPADDRTVAVAPTAGRLKLGTDEHSPAVLNVGGASKQIPIPDHYRGWRHLLLDIAPGPDVDVVKDARELADLPAALFDAIYCSHNLEHYYKHDARKVLTGFLHVLKADGYAEIRVPDMQAVFRAMIERGLDIDDVLYTAPVGPITVHDVIYGWGREIERSGVEFYAHKQGYSQQSLAAALEAAGFAKVYTMPNAAGYEIRALAFVAEPNDVQRERFGV